MRVRLCWALNLTFDPIANLQSDLTRIKKHQQQQKKSLTHSLAWIRKRTFFFYFFGDIEKLMYIRQWGQLYMPIYYAHLQRKNPYFGVFEVIVLTSRFWNLLLCFNFIKNIIEIKREGGILKTHMLKRMINEHLVCATFII